MHLGGRAFFFSARVGGWAPVSLSSLPPALPRESHDSCNTSTLAARAAVFVKTRFLGVRNRVLGCVLFSCFVVRDTTPVAGK